MKRKEETLILHNGSPVRGESYQPDPSRTLYYEVIRVIDSRYLFLEDHLGRMIFSVTSDGLKPPDIDRLRSDLLTLLKLSDKKEGNVKLVIRYEEGVYSSWCFFTPHRYPGRSGYYNGVAVRSYPYERPDPQVKKWNEVFRKDIQSFKKAHHIYEAILVNDQGYLTEGSRSNLFFIDPSDKICTAPLSMVLPGITRKYIIQICTTLSVEIEEKAVPLNRASGMKAAFLSGTSPRVLPIRKLDHIPYNPKHPLLRTIMSGYDNLLKENLYG